MNKAVAMDPQLALHYHQESTQIINQQEMKLYNQIQQ
jgi:hypothetical protein